MRKSLWKGQMYPNLGFQYPEVSIPRYRYPERRGSCVRVRSSFLQLPSSSPDGDFLSSLMVRCPPRLPHPRPPSSFMPALHSPLLPSSQHQPPSWPLLRPVPLPGAPSPPPCLVWLTPTSGRSKGFTDQPVWMECPQVCLNLGSPPLTVLLSPV